MASVDLQEKGNFTRLSRLLVDKGTEALRNTFDTIHSPSSLPAVLATKRTYLLRLKPRVINNSQWDLLFPPSGNPPDSKTFDITLLTVLFRNICGLPSSGWDVLPLPTDRSKQANILRIKSLRNEIYAHVTSTQVDNATFEYLWKKTSQALVELNIPQNDVEDLKTCPLGPEEEVYVKILKEWKLQEDKCLKMLEDIGCSIDRLTQITEENHDRIDQLCQSFEKQSKVEAAQNSMMHAMPVSKPTNHEKNFSRESDEKILRKLAKNNFKGKIRNKIKFFLFGTREWLLNDVHDWFFKGDNESRMLLLTAGPGFGKSVFAAKVCEDFKKNGKLAACHFCDFSNSNLRDPMMMLQSLASQMCENIVGFQAKLLDQLQRPHRVQSLKDAFLIYLQNPLDELELDEPGLVVVDGLDESAADDKNEIMNLIADYFPDLPKYIKVLLTSRPEIAVTKLSGIQKIDIKSNDGNNNLDLELYFEACLPSLAYRKVYTNSSRYLLTSEETVSVLSAVAESCEGSFLYAYHVQSELQTRGDLQKMKFDEIIEFLPEGLDSIYHAYFKRLEDELRALMQENFDVLKILEMIASSKGPLPLTFISLALGLASDCREAKGIINRIGETVSCLLYVSDNLLTVFHKSVIDWLLAKGYKNHKYTVQVDDGNRSLWLICENVFEEIVKRVEFGHDLNLTNDVKYALDHGLEHLVECNSEENIFWSVDVVIIHYMLVIYPEVGGEDKLFHLWKRILQSSLVLSDKLRARILWHLVEVEYMYNCTSTMFLGSIRSPFYLEAVVTRTPKGYFSDKEKKIAESLLSNVPRFVELSFCEVEVLPRAFWNDPQGDSAVITAVAVSYDKTMMAVGLGNGKVRVLSIPRLAEIWNFLTKYETIPCCTFTPDDSFVLFGELETALSIAERKEVPFFFGNEETFTYCAFSPSGKRLVTSNSSSFIKLWDVSQQRLLTVLCAEVLVNWCSFSNVGLFVHGDWKMGIVVENPSIEDSESFEEDSFLKEESNTKDSKSDAVDSFCVWNAITWQRSDKRKLSNGKVNEPGVLKRNKCKRCFRPGLNSSDRFEIEPSLPLIILGKPWSAGIYNGVESIFALSEYSLRVIENTHFVTLATWNISGTIPSGLFNNNRKIATIRDNLWLYADAENLIVFRTSAPTQQSLPTEVYSSCFSPDGSRLATCTSDGYINIWNVYSSQVEQRFQSSESGSSFVCWWSEKVLFVFDIFEKVPSLTRYPVDVHLEILFTQSQDVPLFHLVNAFVSQSAVVDFSEGFIIFECGWTEPVKVLDVNGVDGPRMVALPGLEPMMHITVSPGGAFIFGGNENKFYIWKRNAEKPVVYKVFHCQTGRKKSFRHEVFENFVCCFSNDSKVAVVLDLSQNDLPKRDPNVQIIDLDAYNFQGVYFCDTRPFMRQFSDHKDKLFCINKDKVVILASAHSLTFYDMDSGAVIASSLQRHLMDDLLLKTELSPKKNILVFPDIKGDMVFLRLCIPPKPLLANIKRKAVQIDKKIRIREEAIKRMFTFVKAMRKTKPQTNLCANYEYRQDLS